MEALSSDVQSPLAVCRPIKVQVSAAPFLQTLQWEEGRVGIGHRGSQGKELVKVELARESGLVLGQEIRTI